jgi:hypothetical protein
VSMIGSPTVSGKAKSSSFSGCQLTGDTVESGKSAWKEAQGATVMFVSTRSSAIFDLLSNLFQE